MPRFTTKELSGRTWPDYVRFFSRGNGWDHCGCLSYQGFRPPSSVRKWSDKRDWSLELKRRLLERGLAHGVLVYAQGDPVGWCQFGIQGELPVPDEERKAMLNGAPGWKRLWALPTTEHDSDRFWRITCFCTDKEFGQQGIARLALRAALAAIRKRGGGLVEAYPMATIPKSDERLVAVREWRRSLFKLIKEHGRLSRPVERHLATAPPPIDVHIPGLGEVKGMAWVYGWMHAGTVRMFQAEGFTAVSVWGSGPRVVMHKAL